MSAPKLYAFPERDKLDEDGEPLVRYFSLLNLKDLKLLCQAYKIRYSGFDKAGVLKKLVEFSTNRASWSLIVPGNVQSHVGPQPGSKTTKGSTKRWKGKNRSNASAPERSLNSMDPLAWPSKASPFPVGTILQSISDVPEGRLALYFIPKSAESDSTLLPLQKPGGTLPNASSGRTPSNWASSPPPASTPAPCTAVRFSNFHPPSSAETETSSSSVSGLALTKALTSPPFTMPAMLQAPVLRPTPPSTHSDPLPPQYSIDPYVTPGFISRSSGQPTSQPPQSHQPTGTVMPILSPPPGYTPRVHMVGQMGSPYADPSSTPYPLEPPVHHKLDFVGRSSLTSAIQPIPVPTHVSSIPAEIPASISQVDPSDGTGPQFWSHLSTSHTVDRRRLLNQPDPERRYPYRPCERDCLDPPVFDRLFHGCMKEVIHRVLKWWDDRRPEWDPAAARLIINVDGRMVAIPATRWKELYVNRMKRKQWGGLKCRISDLNLFLDAYDTAARVGCLDNFWMQFMEQPSTEGGGGEIACYTTAMKMLRKKRMVNNKSAAAGFQATEDYTKHFSYTNKAGQVVPLTDPAAIVRRARQRPG
ncbi:hypothetical protein C8J57DRAFT_1226495 [Mycena rebaudengoi]|nr:hypothetical protein C8J57DRAFT_1226495 [Mycena rebaudengoi]